MEYREKEIKKIFPQFWKEKQSEIKYFNKGKEIFPDSVEKCIVLNIEKGDFADDCNFCINLDLGDVYINKYGKPTTGKATIKVGYKVSENSNVPIDVIEFIRNNRIDLL